MPTASDYITKIKDKSNRVQNSAPTYLLCDLGQSLNLSDPQLPNDRLIRELLWDCQMPTASRETQKKVASSSHPFPPVFPPTLSLQEAGLSISMIAGKNHFPIFWDNKQQNLFPESLLNATLYKKLYLYYLWVSLKPKKWHTERWISSLECRLCSQTTGFTTCVTLSKWLSHSVPVSLCFSFLLKDTAFTS